MSRRYYIEFDYFGRKVKKIDMKKIKTNLNLFIRPNTISEDLRYFEFRNKRINEITKTRLKILLMCWCFTRPGYSSGINRGIVRKEFLK